MTLPLRNDQYHASLEEIADELGLSRERVRQIQNRALAKLKAGLEQRGYTGAKLFGPDGLLTDYYAAVDCPVEPPPEQGVVSEGDWRAKQKKEREKQRERDERLLQQCYDKGGIRRTTKRRAKLPR